MSWDILSKANLQYLLTRLKEVTDSIKRGHTIKDDSGTSLAQKDDMQFGGVYSHNDGTTTKVDIVREFNSPSAVTALTGEAAKGFQHTPDTVYKGRTASDIGFDKTGTSFNSTRVQDVLEEVDERLNGIVYNYLFYRKGDTLTLSGNDIFAGRLGWNGKKLLFTIPLSKPIANDVTSITDNISSIYLCTSTAATNATNLTNTSVVTKHIAKRDSYLLFTYEFTFLPTPSAVDGVCNVMINGTYTVTFS